MRTDMNPLSNISRTRVLALGGMLLVAACGGGSEPGAPEPSGGPQPTAADADVPAAERLAAMLPAEVPVRMRRLKLTTGCSWFSTTITRAPLSSVASVNAGKTTSVAGPSAGPVHP